LEYARSSVLGIDFGSEFYKAVLVKPGKPFQILENTSSQRKTESAVTFTQEERLFEKDAVSQSIGYPQTSMLGSLNLLGLKYTEENLNYCKNNLHYTNAFIEDERGMVGYHIDIPGVSGFESSILHVEEVLSMILAQTKNLAKKQGGSAVKDITITVPSYFTINQRIMLRDAAELAGFNVLSMVHENTAAALMYGIDNKDGNMNKKVLFVNMGASDLELSIVQYSIETNGKQTNCVI
jgi:hypoxia up-regulated 1